jgi:coproporphyrinogen III oxidase-like Fe-S oxidoreductase
MNDPVRHLYVHLPFCAHRCGYCDFVTVVGRRGQHAAYVDGLLAELEHERELLAPELETVFLGGAHAGGAAAGRGDHGRGEP